MIAPLCDSRGQIRYHIGAQVDVSGLVKDCTDLESFQQLVMDRNEGRTPQLDDGDDAQRKDEFQEVSESCRVLFDHLRASAGSSVMSEHSSCNELWSHAVP